MVTSTIGRQLTERQRREQLALRAAALVAVSSVWSAFDIRAVDESWFAIEPTLMAVIAAQRRESADVAASYYTALRAVEEVPGRFTPPIITDTAWRARAEASLRITGPIAAKHAIAANIPNVAEAALVRVSGAVTRHIMDGGRETLLESVHLDSEYSGRRVGWARVGSGDPCAFCAMLISRGAVYRRETGGFQSHDHCACTLEPQFQDAAPPTAQSRRYKSLWNDAGGDFKAFRQLVEG